MESTITSHKTAQSIEKPIFKVSHPVHTETYVEKAKAHKGHTVAYFIWTYVVIFTLIGSAVVVAEEFFFTH